jgi:hypothetical protein
MVTLLGNMEGAPLPGTFRENEISRGGLKRVLETGVSVGAPFGELGGGPSTGNIKRSWKEGSINGASLSIRELC